MTDYRFSRFFRQISFAVLTPLLIISLILYKEAASMTAREALRVYHSFPYMMEHILCGLAAYLAFSAFITKIHCSSMHDGGERGQK